MVDRTPVSSTIIVKETIITILSYFSSVEVIGYANYDKWK